jgi:hypothetical protein
VRRDNLHSKGIRGMKKASHCKNNVDRVEEEGRQKL